MNVFQRSVYSVLDMVLQAELYCSDVSRVLSLRKHTEHKTAVNENGED